MFTNYVYKILAFSDHLPPCVYIFYGMNVYKKWTFWTTYLPSLVNVVCERPLISVGINWITLDYYLQTSKEFLVLASDKLIPSFLVFSWIGRSTQKHNNGNFLKFLFFFLDGNKYAVYSSVASLL